MLAQTLKELRFRRGITQREFARDLGVSQQAVGGWEVSRTEPSAEMLLRIAQYFHVSVDYLLGNDQPPRASFSEDEHRIVNMYRTLSDADRAALARMIAALFAQQQHAL